MNLTVFLVRASCSPRLRSFYGNLCGLPVVGGPSRRVVRHVLPPGTRVWARVAVGFGKGLRLCADPRYEQDYLNGVHESLIQEAILRHLQRGGVFYDVGAHIGFFSLLAARAVGEEGEVAAFEADPENAARIREHVDRNALAQVRVFPLAVWSKRCRVRFERASEFSSRNQGAVVQASDTALGADGIEVEATTLDSYARDHRPPTVIKVDAEGGEAEVLEGAAEGLYPGMVDVGAPIPAAPACPSTAITDAPRTQEGRSQARR